MVPHRRYPIVVALILMMALAMLPAGTSADELSGDPPDIVEFGAWGTVYHYTLRVTNVELDAGDLLHAFDPSLPSIAGASHVLVQMEATYTGDGAGTPGVDLWYSVTDGERHVDVTDHACGRWPFSPDTVTLQPGETGRFNLCFVLPTRQMMDHDIELIAHTNLITDQWPVPFSLDEPMSDDLPDCACLPPPPCGCVLPPTDTDLG